MAGLPSENKIGQLFQHPQKKHYHERNNTSTVLGTAEQAQAPAPVPFHLKRNHAPVRDDANGRLLGDEVGNSRMKAASEHYMTTQQRDSALTHVCPATLNDDVGRPTRRRGKRMVQPAFEAAKPATLSVLGGSGLDVIRFARDDEPDPAPGGGHIPGYTGNKNVPPQPRPHNHDKSYHLLPENYQHQVPGYSGRNAEFNGTYERK